MVRIKLTRRMFALIDNEDFLRVNSLGKWQVGSKGYVTMKKWNGEKYIALKMHRIVLNMPMFDKRKIDHKNLNKLDNQKHNLRICDDTLNNLNVPKRKGDYTSLYKGVYKKKNRWYAAITLKSIRKNIGSFKKEKDAAIAYNKEAKNLFGEFAWLNKI